MEALTNSTVNLPVFSKKSLKPAIDRNKTRKWKKKWNSEEVEAFTISRVKSPVQSNQTLKKLSESANWPKWNLKVYNFRNSESENVEIFTNSYRRVEL